MTDQNTTPLSAYAEGIALGPDLLGMTAGIVAAFVGNNHVVAGDIPGLLATVHSGLAALDGNGAPAAPAEPAVEKPTPAQIRKSITPDALVSFIDGKPYKTLKRHLTSHGLEPRGYRERFGLPADYPMTAPSYAAQRSALAKAIGLGKPGAMAEQAGAPVESKPRGRKAA